MGPRISVAIVVALASCYSPSSFTDCAITCTFGAAATCPDGYTCGESNRCSPSGAGCIGDVLYDGPPATDDAAPPGSDCHGRGSLLEEVCPTRQPAATITLTNIDTDTDPRCEAISRPNGEPTLCVVHAMAIEVPIGTTVNAVGSRPLVLFADASITIDGRLDASSDGSDGESGAGAFPGCGTPAGVSSATAVVVGAGGAGATYAGKGGVGGAGDGAVATQPIQTVAPLPPFVRGGCTGGAGGLGMGSLPGPGGAGGGVLYLVARSSITVNGILAANGSGGFQDGTFSSEVRGGGGGGGSGGLIVLDAPLVSLGNTAKLIAAGGGGGGGSSSVDRGMRGGSPNIGTASPGLVVAIGGAGGATTGGTGGNGSSNLSRDGANGLAAGAGGGGGGGGGGEGFIITYCTPGSCPTYPSLTIPGGRNVNP